MTSITSFIATAVVYTPIDSCGQYLKLPLEFVINVSPNGHILIRFIQIMIIYGESS